MANRNRPVAMPTPINGADADHGLGEFFDQFPQPRRIADLTVMEATEIKTRNKVLDRLNADIDHLVKARAIVANEKVTFLRSIASRSGLDDRDEISANDDTGVVLHTGRRRYVQPPEVEAEPLPTADAEAPTDASPVN